MTKFTHLHVHSHYSLLDGLSKIPGLIDRVKELGMDSVALTDHGNLYGAIEFYKTAKKEGVKPILGMEAYYAPNGRQNKGTQADKTRYHLILLAKNNLGWKNLLALSTKANLEGFYYKPRIDDELIKEHSEGLICLSACLSGEVSKLISKDNYKKAKERAKWFKSIFGDDYYLEIQPHTQELHESMKRLSEELDIPLVTTQDAHYLKEEDRDAHEVLLAVQTRSPLEQSERLSLKEFNLSLRPPEEMTEIFKNFPEALENTAKIADKCDVEIELGVNKMPNFALPEGETAQSYLEKLARDRLSERYDKVDEEITKRLEHELSVIKKTGFANYFLIVQDIVNWAKDHGIVVGPGRGSAAGSLVSYVLGITNVDPLKYDLLFERFLNPDRNEMPDIDIDFADARRDEVIAYSKQKYGDDHVAQIITFGTMMARAAIRDTGRALGLPYSLCDKIAKLIPFNTSIDKSLKEVEELKKEYDSDQDTKSLIDYARKLEGVVRHASVHACGVVISPEPLTTHVPLQRAPQGDDAVITQFEMHSVEDLGLLKMDFLGLRNLTTIESALHLIRDHYGEDVDIQEIPLDDRKTFQLLQKGNTTGVFQLESSGMRRYLKEMKPAELEDIITMIALYRPGPIELIPLYLKRRFGEESVSYIHSKLEPILGSTYGVGIYQEQMMRIARDLAGFTLAEADTLRKAIGKKIKKLLDQQKEKLIRGMVKNGIDEKTAKSIWELFPPFARYGFNKSHSASYAMISYQTAFLKANYPIEFTIALLNTSSGDMDRINFLVSDARDMGIDVLPPDINVSEKQFAVDETGKNIRFGLLAVKNLGYNIVEALIEERRNGGPYQDLSDLLSRVHHRDLNKKSIESLIKCGALDSFEISRGQMMENIEEIIKFNQASRKMSISDQGNLFGSINQGTLMLKPASNEANEKEILGWEKELLGLYLTAHPFSHYVEKVRGKTQPIKDILDVEQGETSGQPVVAGIISNIKKIITKKGDPMMFVTLEDDSDSIEVLVFSDTLSKTSGIWEEGGAVILTGKISWRDDKPKILCDKAKPLRA